MPVISYRSTVRICRDDAALKFDRSHAIVEGVAGAGLDLLFHNSISPMDTPTYPGKGLSLSQLVFALNQELRHTGYSSSYVEKEKFWTNWE